MPGASGLKAANYMATSAPRDGAVIAATHAGILTAQLTSPGAATFDAGRLSWIGSITTDPFVGYVWHTTPIKTLADTRTTEVIMGGVSVGSASVDYGILARDLFGLKLKLVNGYKSSNDVKLAMERGEVQGAFANGWSSIRNAEPEWIRDGKIRIIVQHGFQPLPELPDVPLLSRATRTARRCCSCWRGRRRRSPISRHRVFRPRDSPFCAARSTRPCAIRASWRWPPRRA
jgi:tripartite-type tricarboxylate transporter receptor subunit TctC